MSKYKVGDRVRDRRFGRTFTINLVKRECLGYVYFTDECSFGWLENSLEPIEPDQPKPTRQTVYLAGKITGDNSYKEKFSRAHSALLYKGYMVLSPHILPLGFSQDAYMRITAAMLAECEVVCFLPDWRDSIGAKTEMKQAIELGKTIIFYSEEVAG